MNRERLKQPPIQPIYPQAEPNEPINLGTVAVQFTYKDKTYDEEANVVMSFLPKDLLSFTIHENLKFPLNGCAPVGNHEWNGKFILKDRGVTLDVFCVACSLPAGKLVFVPKTSCVTVSTPAQAVSKAVFHLFNFPSLIAPDNYILVTGKPPNQGGKLCDRVILKADGWCITIVGLDKTADLDKVLREKGGYAVTHMGSIEREDGSAFTSEQLEDIISCCHHFLSFTLGRWAGVGLPIGYDKSAEKVFEQWGMRISAEGAWSRFSSWFDSHHGELLTQVFPGFMRLWKSSLWRGPLGIGLYWYLGACERGTGIGVDTGLILAQTALELLAWTYCVKDRRIVQPKKFKLGGLSAAKKLRLLLFALKIPLSIPQELSALQAYRINQDDGPDVITHIRNSLVHPKKSSPPPEGCYFEAWLLSLWYVDMILLCLCGHTGDYANRLDFRRYVGTVEQVPYAKKAGTP